MLTSGKVALIGMQVGLGDVEPARHLGGMDRAEEKVARSEFGSEKDWEREPWADKGQGGSRKQT